MEFACPKCSEKLNVEPIVTVPAEQRVAMRIKYDGSNISAKTLGRSILNMASLLVVRVK